MATEEASSRLAKAGVARGMPADASETQIEERREGSSRTITILQLTVCPLKNCFSQQQEEQLK